MGNTVEGISFHKRKERNHFENRLLSTVKEDYINQQKLYVMTNANKQMNQQMNQSITPQNDAFVHTAKISRYVCRILQEPAKKL